MPLYKEAHLLSRRCEMALPRSSALQKGRARCPCSPSLPTSGAARQRARRALRGAGASNLLRVSHRAAAIMRKSPLALRAGRASSSRPRLAQRRHALLSAGISHMRAASHQSGELMAGSFTGISAGRIEAQRGGCPLIRSCIHYQILWLSRFAPMQRGLSPLAGKHLRNWHRSFCRPFYMQSHRRCSC